MKKNKNTHKKLLLVSGSSVIKRDPPSPTPAIQRFDGAFPRLIRKYYKQMKNIDVLFFSCTYGLIKADKKITFKEQLSYSWYKPIEFCSDINQVKKDNTWILEEILSSCQYNEIYVNIGKKLMEFLPNLEEIVTNETKITHSKGRGIGPKMTHMKQWIESQIIPKN